MSKSIYIDMTNKSYKLLRQIVSNMVIFPFKENSTVGDGTHYYLSDIGII